MMVKEHLKKNSDISSTNNTTIKQSIDKRALTSRVLKKNIHNPGLNLAFARKSMNMIYEKPSGGSGSSNMNLKTKSKFNSIGHAGQMTISNLNNNSAQKKTETKKPLRTERNKTQVNFKEL